MKKYTVTLIYIENGIRQTSTYTADRKAARAYYNYFKRKIGKGTYTSIQFSEAVLLPAH